MGPLSFFPATWLGFLSKLLWLPRSGHTIPAVLAAGRSESGVPSHAVPDGWGFNFSTVL